MHKVYKQTSPICNFGEAGGADCPKDGSFNIWWCRDQPSQLIILPLAHTIIVPNKSTIRNWKELAVPLF